MQTHQNKKDNYCTKTDYSKTRKFKMATTDTMKIFHFQLSSDHS